MKAVTRAMSVLVVLIVMVLTVEVGHASTYESTMGTLSFMKENYEKSESYIEPSMRYMLPGSKLLAQWGAERSKDPFNVMVSLLELRTRSQICDFGEVLRCKLYAGAYLPTHWDNPERFRYDAMLDFILYRKFGIEFGRQGNWNIGTGNRPGMSLWNIGTYYVFSDESKGFIPAGRVFYRHYMGTEQAATLTREFGVSVLSGDRLMHEFGAQLQWSLASDRFELYAMPTSFAGSSGLQKVGGTAALQWRIGRELKKVKEVNLENMGVEVNVQYFRDVSGLSSVGDARTEAGSGIRIFWGF